MIKRGYYGRAIYLCLLLAAPETALANVIIPMTVVTVPMMWLMLGAIIIVEFIVLNKVWKDIKISSLIMRISFANFVSTLIGVPIAWCVYYKGISMPGSLMLDGIGRETIENLPEFIRAMLSVVVNAPFVWRLDNFKQVYVNFLLLMPIAYFLSYWIEYMFFEFEGISEEEILRGVRLANRASYLFVLGVVSIWFWIISNNESNCLYKLWACIVDKFMWLILLTP